MEKSICSAHNYFWGIRWGERDWVSDCSSHGNLFRSKDFSQDSHLREGYYVCLVRESNKGQPYTNSCSDFLRSHPRHPLMCPWNITADEVTEGGCKSGMKGQRPAWRRWRRTTSGSHGAGRGLDLFEQMTTADHFLVLFVYATEEPNRRF